MEQELEVIIRDLRIHQVCLQDLQLRRLQIEVMLIYSLHTHLSSILSKIPIKFFTNHPYNILIQSITASNNAECNRYGFRNRDNPVPEPTINNNQNWYTSQGTGVGSVDVNG